MNNPQTYILNDLTEHYLNNFMKPGFQKEKFNRKSSATSTSKERLSVFEKEKKLQQLREKIEKDRDVMSKTGKRFNKQGELTTSQSNISLEGVKQIEKIEKSNTLTPFFKKQTKPIQFVSTDKEEKQQQTAKLPAVEKIDLKLTELIPSSKDKTISLQVSRIFGKEINQQKVRNQQIYKFLDGLALQQFAEGLINMGYDELSVLVEIKSEELNFLMMRAPQQRKLAQALKGIRLKSGLQEEKAEPLIDKPSAFKTKVKMNVESQREIRTSSLLNRPKSALTQTSTIPTNNSSLFSNPSFFCSIGGNDWSMDSLIRRACSSCFKVYPSNDLKQRDSCYYCKPCTQMQQDLLGLTLSDSMVRDYSS